MISVESIYVSIIITALYIFRVVHFLILGKNKISTKLFSLPYIFLFVGIILSGLASTILALFFSHTFSYNGFFFLFTGAAIICGGMYLILYFIFFGHGYDPRYQFSFLKLPCPFAVLTSIVYLLGSFLTSNYYLLISVSIFIIFSFIFDYLGYKETKPKVDLDLPVPPDEY